MPSNIFKKVLSIIVMVSFITSTHSQTIPQRLAQAIKQFESDPQLRHAITSLCVADAKTGKKIYAHNEQIGLAPASTQKLFTSAAAFELLGKDFRYKTSIGYNGKIQQGCLAGGLYVVGSGDPSFGSWRWKETRDTVILRKFVDAAKRAGITKSVSSRVSTIALKFTHQAIPDGWIWQDIGNYYGAGAYAINWRENQYDLYLQSGNKIGDSVKIAGAKPSYLVTENYINELRSAAKGSGDNAYIYLGLGTDRHPLLRGTIPVGERSFSISGASPDPVNDFVDDLTRSLNSESIQVNNPCGDHRDEISRQPPTTEDLKIIATHQSPGFDSMNYYFMRRSINLYGEAFVKTIALEKNEMADTEKGMEILRDFWNGAGIEKSAIHIVDGSGLSPQNRVTTDAEVAVLRYAQSRPWFSSFYHSLPEFNGMKMKSGSIGGARAYAGYHTAKDGKAYIFSIIVNNYDGSAGEVVRKIYKVLDILK
jgi:serine-type D-Ala-D-Ala carboxypeptidase/endopeptidase (penicillin-binding protein 4)